MKRYLLPVWLVGLLLAVPFPVLAADTALRVFACEPEWASLAREIGGKRISTFSATHAQQDPHYIRARPRLIAKIRRADILICSGGGLESGWLPILQQKANTQLQSGGAGRVIASERMTLADKPHITLDRRHGDMHGQGNPHVHLNPHRITHMAHHITRSFIAQDPQRQTTYTANLKRFLTRWHAAITRWEKQAAPLKGKRAIVHHRGFFYLLDWLGIKRAASLEPKPGLPPTASHLEHLLQQTQTTPVDVIIRTPYEPPKASLWLSEKTGTPAVILPYTVGNAVNAPDLFALFDETLTRLIDATSKGRKQ